MPKPSKGNEFLETRKKMRGAAKRKRMAWIARKEATNQSAMAIREEYKKGGK